MKAISLHQPWAIWVAMKWKTIETRTHDRFKSLLGQRIAIHAAKKVDVSALSNRYIPLKDSMLVQNMWLLTKMSGGCVVCTAKVVGHGWMGNTNEIERSAFNKQAMCEVAGKFLLFLDDIQMLRDRVPFRGTQGIFNVPDELTGETVPK